MRDLWQRGRGTGGSRFCKALLIICLIASERVSSLLAANWSMAANTDGAILMVTGTSRSAPKRGLPA